MSNRKSKQKNRKRSRQTKQKVETAEAQPDQELISTSTYSEGNGTGPHGISALEAIAVWHHVTKIMDQAREIELDARKTRFEALARQGKYFQAAIRLIDDASRDFELLDDLYDWYQHWTQNQESYETYFILTSALTDNIRQQFAMVSCAAARVHNTLSVCLSDMELLVGAARIKRKFEDATDRWAKTEPELNKVFVKIEDAAWAQVYQENTEAFYAYQKNDVADTTSIASKPNELDNAANEVNEESDETLNDAVNEDLYNDIYEGTRGVTGRNTMAVARSSEECFSQLTIQPIAKPDEQIPINRTVLEVNPTPQTTRRCAISTAAPVKTKIKTRGTPDPERAAQEPGRFVEPEIQAEQKWLFKDAKLYDIWSQIFPPSGLKDKTSDMTWEAFVKAMTSEPLCFAVQKAPHAGVEVRFVRPPMNGDAQTSIVMHKPHGNGVLQRNFIYTIKTRFRQKFGWSAEDFVLAGED